MLSFFHHHYVQALCKKHEYGLSISPKLKKTSKKWKKGVDKRDMV